MKRRDFINLFGGALAASALGARAQQSTMPMIGFVRSSSLDSVANLVAAFRQGLKETGYIELTLFRAEFSISIGNTI